MGLIGALVGILFVLVLMGVFFWAIQTVMERIPTAEPFKTIVYVVLVTFAIEVVTGG